MVEKEDQLEFNNYEEDEDEELNDTVRFAVSISSVMFINHLDRIILHKKMPFSLP